jgi:hypothetical protein
MGAAFEAAGGGLTHYFVPETNSLRDFEIVLKV